MQELIRHLYSIRHIFSATYPT